MPWLGSYYVYETTLILTLVVQSAAAYYHGDSEILLVSGIPLFFLATGPLIRTYLHLCERSRVAQRG